MFIASLSAFRSRASVILHSPFALQASVLTFLVFFITSFRPPYQAANVQPFGPVAFGEETIFSITEEGFLDNYIGVRTAGFDEIEVIDANGNISTQLVPRQRNQIIEYTTKSGENLTKIAHKFSLDVRTLLWSNELTVGQSIPLGTILRIPVTDGVFYTVQKGETLGEITQAHGAELNKVFAYNALPRNGSVKVDQEIFIPDARKIFVAVRPPDLVAIVPIVKPTTPDASATAGPEPLPSSSNGRTAPTSLPGSQISALGYKLRRPTQGTLTQGYHSGHYALDIADALNTPIYAAAPGKVITSQAGWNGGYGNYIIIDHGNDVQTLYGHNNVRKVEVGDWVEAGELIALMGNTGRVFGRTGIHLHFELRIRDRKVNPINYF
jgi:murein DD-endopeptidase MepM/ murein hydrolase activator NlpD